MSVPFDAVGDARVIVHGIGRTEDLAFNADGSRLAIADFSNDEIVLFDVDVDAAASRVRLTHGFRLASTDLASPHGVAFVGERHVAVANRGGGVRLFEVPDVLDGSVRKVDAIAELSDDSDAGSTPGSVAVRQIGQTSYELLVCHNYTHVVSRQRVDLGEPVTSTELRPLLRRWMDIPDGVAFSPDSRWIAVSNHNMNAVLLYRYDDELGPESDPVGIARGVAYPHGLAFGPDGSTLFTADAGSRYAHVHRVKDGEWAGVHLPIASTRVVDEAAFQAGRHNAAEGGPKGIALHPTSPIVAVTCEEVPLTFVEVDVLESSANVAHAQVEVDLAIHAGVVSQREELARVWRDATAIAGHRDDLLTEVESLASQVRDLRWRADTAEANVAHYSSHYDGRTRQVEELRERLADARAAAKAAERQLARLRRSRSWRWTRSLRRLEQRRRRLRGSEPPVIE